MSKSSFEISYQSTLNVIKTQRAIKFIKDHFQKRLSKQLKLERVSAPLFVTPHSGLNDGLSGVEKPVSFRVQSIDKDVEIVHSLAKWKRWALAKYDIPMGQGLYTDMNAIRKDEKLDFLHSIYVDQWDWEIALEKSKRRFSTLKAIVKKIYACIVKTEEEVCAAYPEVKPFLGKDIVFVSTKELEERFPNLTRKEREDAITREYGAVFLYQIGGKLKDGKPHDSRAADYDDWKLNGDILIYYPLYDMAFELSSMGIRVDEVSLVRQMKAAGRDEELNNPYCQSILKGEIPYSIGGGIGQSRLCMALLQKAHIGEVQASIWDEEEVAKLKEKGIFLL